MRPDEQLAQRIRDRRKELGLTEGEVADRLHDNDWPALTNTEATYQLVQKVERRNKPRRLTVVEKRLFAHALECDPASLEKDLAIQTWSVRIIGVTARAHARKTPPQ
jgi:transcriptional regulator with XRE-family HTH domain